MDFIRHALASLLILLFTVSSGISLAGGAAVVGHGDDLVDGVTTVVNGVPVRNPTVAALMTTFGMSFEQATQAEGWIEAGASIVEAGGGLVVAVKSGTVVGTTRVTPVRMGDVATGRTMTPAQQRALERLEREGVTIASPNASISGTGEVTPLLNRIRNAGGTLDISRGEISAHDLAALSRASGNEMAIFRDRATGQLRIRELGPQMGQIPENSRLIIHSQPGSGPLSVQPSTADRAALVELNQRSSVIINSDGTFTVRFRSDNVGDGPITPIGDE